MALFGRRNYDCSANYYVERNGVRVLEATRMRGERTIFLQYDKHVIYPSLEALKDDLARRNKVKPENITLHRWTRQPY